MNLEDYEKATPIVKELKNVVKMITNLEDTEYDYKLSVIQLTKYHKDRPEDAITRYHYQELIGAKDLNKVTKKIKVVLLANLEERKEVLIKQLADIGRKNEHGTG